MRTKTSAWTSWESFRRGESAVACLSSGGHPNCAYFFPSDYSVGMSNLGFHYIYRALLDNGVGVERFFYAPFPFRSVEHDTMLERFDVILASISYECDVLHLTDWLLRGGIDPFRSSRHRSGGKLVGAGGAITYINPMLLAGSVDFIMLGDGVSLVSFLAEQMRSSKCREEILQALADHPSFYVPELDDLTKGNVAKKVNKEQHLDEEYGHSTWIAENAVFGRTLLIELQRGCTNGCRYCTLPSCFRPFRQRSLSIIKDDIEMAISTADFDKVGLITPEASDFNALDDLLDFLAQKGKSVSFASLRVDRLNERMIESLAYGGHKSITVAPEAGNDELRRCCGKRFSNEVIVERLAMAAKIGMTNAKLYFMIGLPDETDADVLSIAQLCRSARQETGIRIFASVTPFVPKPGTSWSDQTFAGERELKRRAKMLQQAFNGVKGTTVTVASIKEALTEYRLAWSTPSASAAFVADRTSLAHNDDNIRSEAAEMLRSFDIGI